MVKKYPRIVIPACGQFTLAKCAIEAGYLRENIFTSDISLYSALLGYLYSGKPISELDFEIIDEEIKKEYQEYTTDYEKVAFLLFVMKKLQIRDDIYFQKIFLDEMINQKEQIVSKLAKLLEQLSAYYKGINFELKDLRAELTQDRVGNNQNTTVIVNPPAFAGGYKKMFAFEKVLKFNFTVDEWNFNKEYDNTYAECKKLDVPVIFYKYKSRGKYVQDVIFAKEYGIDRYEYWLFTKPELLKELDIKKSIRYKKPMVLRPIKGLQVFGEDDVITENTKVHFLKTTAEHALYYRELFGHKLGTTRAETYYLLLLDGKITSTVGFHHSELFRMKTDKVFEVYGFSTHSNIYPRLNRLLMILITCEGFRQVVENQMSVKNRLYDLKGLKTTCMSKYRDVKSNSRLLFITKRIQLKNGFYKTLYETNFWEHDFKEGVKRFLTEKNTDSYVEQNNNNKEIIITLKNNYGQWQCRKPI